MHIFFSSYLIPPLEMQKHHPQTKKGERIWWGKRKFFILLFGTKKPFTNHVARILFFPYNTKGRRI